jgi:hypothetical protein
LNTALLDDLNNQSSSLSIDSLVYKANLKPQLNAIVFANYAPVINNFGYDTAISNGQNGSAGELFAKDIWQNPKKQSAITLLKDKVDINKKSQKMILLKPSVYNILLRFLITTNFKSSKAVWSVEYRIRNS